MIEVLPDETWLTREVGEVAPEETLFMDSLGANEDASDQRVRRLVYLMWDPFTRLQWIELASRCCELLIGGGDVIVKQEPAWAWMEGQRAMERAGLTFKGGWLVAGRLYLRFVRDRTTSTWNIEGELRRESLAEYRARRKKAWNDTSKW